VAKNINGIIGGLSGTGMSMKSLKVKGEMEPIGSLLEGGRVIRLRKGGLLPTLLESSDKRGSLR